jgi:hypothetical protein
MLSNMHVVLWPWLHQQLQCMETEGWNHSVAFQVDVAAVLQDGRQAMSATTCSCLVFSSLCAGSVGQTTPAASATGVAASSFADRLQAQLQAGAAAAAGRAAQQAYRLHRAANAAATHRLERQNANALARQSRIAAVAAAAATPAAPTTDAWSIDGKRVKELLLPQLHGLPSYTQLEDPMPAYIKAASDYRACIDARVQTGEAVCCVCARYLPLVTKDKGAVLPKARDPCRKAWHEVPAEDIPGKQVLVTAEHLGNDANGVAIPRHTPELPSVGNFGTIDSMLPATVSTAVDSTETSTGLSERD